MSISGWYFNVARQLSYAAKAVLGQKYHEKNGSKEW